MELLDFQTSHTAVSPAHFVYYRNLTPMDDTTVRRNKWWGLTDITYITSSQVNNMSGFVCCSLIVSMSPNSATCANLPHGICVGIVHGNSLLKGLAGSLLSHCVCMSPV